MVTRIALVRAPNPSAMTLTGTNTFLVDCGNGEAFCIDPGPPIERHVKAVLARASRMRCSITRILLTHGHPDHAPAAPMLAQHTGALIAAHERSAVPHDINLRDGELVRSGDRELQTMDAPGHTFDHLTFYEPREGALFTGDAVLGQGYVVIAPPNGAMRPYQRTLQRLYDEFPDARTIYGGHGEPIAEPAAKLRDYMEHRRNRQNELVRALEAKPQTIPDLVREIYRDTNQILWPAAARQLLAYLLALENETQVRSVALERPPDAQELAILNPEWDTIAGPEHARTVEAELGAQMRLDTIRRYEVVR